MLQNSFGSPVEAIVRSAWRRRHGLLVLEQLSHALTTILCGVILLLLLGTQILNGYWIALLALSGFAIGIFRLRGRFLRHYQVAQILDRRLQLSDTLSTAWFVLTTTTSYSDAQRQLQMRQAEELASGVQPQIAFPFEGRRAWMASALLLVIACGLFGVRYFAYEHLTLQPALIPIRFSNALEQFEARFLPRSNRPQESPARHHTENGPTLPESLSSGKNTGPAHREGADVNKEPSRSREDRQMTHQLNGDAHEKSTSPEAKSKENLANESASTSGKSPQQSAPVNDPASKNGKDQTTKGSSEEQSLTSKLRDALSGLLAKMQGGAPPQPPNEEANQPPGPNRDQHGATPSSSQQAASENGASKESNASSLQAQQQAHSAEAAPSSRTQGAGDSSGHRSSDTHSAAGHQDGSKEAREAEQLKAMGKLAEIIGKRSASVTGEMSVETPSGKQQLQTNYTYKSGHHAGIGSEMEHTEVPAEDQQYVREYMKQVHAQPETR